MNQYAWFLMAVVAGEAVKGIEAFWAVQEAGSMYMIYTGAL